MKANEQKATYDRILAAAVEQFEEIIHAACCHHCGDCDDRAAVREHLNMTADAICRDAVEAAELREELSEDQAEDLRNDIHDEARLHHPYAPGESPDDYRLAADRAEWRRRERADDLALMPHQRRMRHY